jgi:hypothetical protein
MSKKLGKTYNWQDDSTYGTNWISYNQINKNLSCIQALVNLKLNKHTTSICDGHTKIILNQRVYLNPMSFDHTDMLVS